MRYRKYDRCPPLPPIHELTFSERRTIPRLTVRRRVRQYWCVGLSWYGHVHVRDLALHLGFVTFALKWCQPLNNGQYTAIAAEPLRTGDMVAVVSVARG